MGRCESRNSEATITLTNNANRTVDGLVFSPSNGMCWIQTDDDTYTNQTNCMLTAVLPGDVGDRGKKALPYKREDGRLKQMTTQIGTALSDATLKRFLLGPKGQ